MDKKYFYNVSVYDYESHAERLYYHDKKYNHHEFSLIVQDCIDEAIIEYAKLDEYRKNEPCSLDTYDVIQLPTFNKSMYIRGFRLVRTQASCGIEDSRVFSVEFGSEVLRGRYSDLTLGYCHDCFRDEDEECPVLNERKR